MKIVMTDNFDSIVKALAKLEKEATTEIVKESRKALRSTLRTYIPRFKSITPKDTGALQRSVKIKSRTRRGVTKMSMVWQSRYAGYVNFAKTIKTNVKKKGIVKFYKQRSNPNSKKVTNAFQHLKSRIDRDITISQRNVYRAQFKKRGYKVT